MEVLDPISIRLLLKAPLGDQWLNSRLLPSTYSATLEDDTWLKADLILLDEPTAFECLNRLLQKKKSLKQGVFPVIGVFHQTLSVEQWLALGVDSAWPLFEPGQGIEQLRWLKGLLYKLKTEQKSIYQIDPSLLPVAYLDPATGFSNKVTFLTELKRLQAMSQRRRVSFAILKIRFEVEDRLSKKSIALKEELLFQVVGHLSGCVRESDIVCYLQENEFVLVLLDLSHPEASARVAKKIIDFFSKPIEWKESFIQVKTYIGISLYPKNGEDEKLLLQEADLAMHLAQKNESSHYELCEKSLIQEGLHLSPTEKSIKSALLNNEFHIVYQPIANVLGEIKGVEGLLRWVFPNGESVLPSEIFQLAEETHQSLVITEWILKNACRQVKSWQDRALGKLKISINLSRSLLKEENFNNVVNDILVKTGLLSKYLGFEIAERHLVEDIGRSSIFLKRLKDTGVKITIDSVGESNLSLNYLDLFEIDCLKISKTFIHAMLVDPHTFEEVKDIIKKAHACGIMVIAEGIESVEQLQALKELGCDELQGYYISKPMDNEGLITFLKSKTDLIPSV